MIAQPPSSIRLKRVTDEGVVVEAAAAVRAREAESFVPVPSIEVTAGAFGVADWARRALGFCSGAGDCCP